MSLTLEQATKLNSFSIKAKRTEPDGKGRSGYIFGPAKDFSELYELLNPIRVGYYAEQARKNPTDKKEQDLILVYVLHYQAHKLSEVLADHGLQKREVIQKHTQEI